MEGQCTIKKPAQVLCTPDIVCYCIWQKLRTIYFELKQIWKEYWIPLKNFESDFEQLHKSLCILSFALYFWKFNVWYQPRSSLFITLLHESATQACSVATNWRYVTKIIQTGRRDCQHLAWKTVSKIFITPIILYLRSKKSQS